MVVISILNTCPLLTLKASLPTEDALPNTLVDSSLCLFLQPYISTLLTVTFSVNFIDINFGFGSSPAFVPIIAKFLNMLTQLCSINV